MIAAALSGLDAMALTLLVWSLALAHTLGLFGGGRR